MIIESCILCTCSLPLIKIIILLLVLPHLGQINILTLGPLLPLLILCPRPRLLPAPPPTAATRQRPMSERFDGAQRPIALLCVLPPVFANPPSSPFSFSSSSSACLLLFRQFDIANCLVVHYSILSDLVTSLGRTSDVTI